MAKSIKGKLFLMILALLIGIVIGMTQPGAEIMKLYNTVRFRNTPVAQGFLPNPFHLRVAHTVNDQGELETYLVNTQKSEMLPVLEVEGTTQVGDAQHRIQSIGDETLEKMRTIFEDAKEGGAGALEKAKKLLEGLTD